MTDPLDALRDPVRPVDPDPAFAARLRERLERLVLSAAVIDSAAPLTSTRETTMTTAQAEALPLHDITSYLAVPDAAAALDFYADVFGGVRRGEPIVMPDGRIGHAEIAIGGTVLMLADEFPELGLRAPAPDAVSVSLRLEVADPDAVVDRAVARGARLDRPVGDSPYGRGGAITDPAGHRWMVSRSPSSTDVVVRPGEPGYTSIWTRDVAVADRFYRTVLGWETTEVRDGAARRITNLSAHAGIHGGQEHSTLYCAYGVVDVDETVSLVRAAGGTAQDPTEEPFGRAASCVDDQGLPFTVYAGTGGSGPGRDTTSPGELTYATIEVPDDTRARAFYGTVLGWRFLPGREPGMWHVRVGGTDPRPSLGLAGGREPATVVPMFVVADVSAAVATVRSLGGTATDPTDAGYGTSTECVDDQDGRFWLVQY
ncbi:MAG: VOC family protein [Pseudonocardia sp.]|nr:VOC family protein [Pseudonocardia sp.]